MKSFAAVAVLMAGLAAAQNMPPCAAPCVSKATSGGDIAGCSGLDIACICKNQQFFDDIACCIADKCDKNEQKDAVTFAKQICKSAGVTDVPDEVVCKGKGGDKESSKAPAPTTAPVKDEPKESEPAKSEPKESGPAYGVPTESTPSYGVPTESTPSYGEPSKTYEEPAPTTTAPAATVPYAPPPAGTPSPPPANGTVPIPVPSPSGTPAAAAGISAAGSLLGAAVLAMLAF